MQHDAYARAAAVSYVVAPLPPRGLPRRASPGGGRRGKRSPLAVRHDDTQSCSHADQKRCPHAPEAGCTGGGPEGPWHASLTDQPLLSYLVSLQNVIIRLQEEKKNVFFRARLLMH